MEIQVKIRVKALDHQHPADADEDNRGGSDAAHQHLGFTGGIGIPFPVKIHGKQRGGGVEFGTERSHEGDDHAAGHHAAEAMGENLGDERSIGGITAGGETGIRSLG